jgi:pimeloyl-ACP methyl ester carboxylesterase
MSPSRPSCRPRRPGRPTQSKRPIPLRPRLTRLGRAAVVVACLLALLGTVGTAALVARETEQRRRYPPPGQMIDIGEGRSIHLRIWGGDRPAPTIILDAAASQPSSSWALVAQQLARTHRVIAYDRPGMGWSIGRSGPRDARTSAQALAAALQRSGIGPPYVVVGHSYGGFSARMFAHLQPEHVAGLVLLDTTHHDGGGGPAFAALYRWRAWQAHLGLYQLGAQVDADPSPADDYRTTEVVGRWRSHMDATADELEAWPLSADQLRTAGDHGDMPLLVIAAYGSERQHELQRDLARLSTRSSYVELPVWHTSMLHDLDDAILVSAEIEAFMAGLRR